jgi:hypothetical protein
VTSVYQSFKITGKHYNYKNPNMSYVLEDIDFNKKLFIHPYQVSLISGSILPISNPEQDCNTFELEGRDASLFLDWAKKRARHMFEKETCGNSLQCYAEDLDNKRLLHAFIPLVSFREYFCIPRSNFNDETTALLHRIFEIIKPWRKAEADLVAVSGYLIDR